MTTTFDLADPVWCEAQEIDRMNGVPTNYNVPKLTSWAPICLDEVLAGDYAPPQPAMLARTDGRFLLYPERLHWISAEPEALKTWLLLLLAREQLAAGNVVLFGDFESNEKEIVGRLRALGTPVDAIRERFMYVRPNEPLEERAQTDLDAALERKPSAMLLDGVTEAFTLERLNPLDNTDTADWLDKIPRRAIRAGCAVVAADHVVKDKEARGRYAIGAQHKLAGVDVAYSLTVVEPFGRGRNGVVTIKVQKDRPGGIREYAQDGIVATLRATSHLDGSVSIRLDPPEARDSSTPFRPTGLMEKVSRALEADSGLSVRAVRSAAKGKGEYVDLALELLISEGFVRTEPGARNSTRHYSVRPYRDDDPTTVSPPCPDRVPDTVDATVSRVPTLIGDTVTEHTNTTTDNPDRVPDPELQERADELHARHRSTAT
jgi:hypothetical protein